MPASFLTTALIRVRWAAGTRVATAALAMGLWGGVADVASAQSVPPPLTQGPVVSGPIGQPIQTDLLASERDLNIEFTDLADLTPVYVTIENGQAVTHVITANPPGSLIGDGTNIYFNTPARYAPETGTATTDPNIANPNQTFSTSFSYRLFESSATNTITIGGGVTAVIRVGGVELTSATASTSAEAQALALSQLGAIDLPGRRLPAIVNSSGLVESISETSASAIVARDSYQTQVIVFGPDSTVIGNRGTCDQPFGACQGGVTYVIADEDEGNFDLYTMQDLYVLTTTTRTVTSTGTALMDVPIAHEGVAHAAAQTVGFASGDRFLRRLTTPGAAGFGQPLGPSDEASRWRVFLEGTGAVGDLSNDRYHFQALRGGLSRVINPNLDLGLAFEAGTWSYKHPDAFVPERAEGDLWRLGAFARYTPGPWRLHGAVIGGEQDLETTGISLAGAGTSRAKARARIYGAGAEVGYAIPVDGFTLTPHARLTALRWTSPAVVETGGTAPLSIAKATREQVRLALGATLGKRYEVEPGLDLGVEIGARAFTTTGDTHGRVVASDAIAPTSFVIDGPSGERSGVELSAGVTLVKDGRMAIAASYEGRFAGDEQSHAGMLTLKMAF